MSDDRATTSQPVPVDPPAAPEGGPEEFPVDRLRRRLGRRMGGRPLMVYVVLFAGAATLLLLLAVVWISATNNGDGEAEFCTEISPAEAQAAVLGGQVQRVRVLVDQDQPVETLTGILLELRDDVCRQMPQGADRRAELFGVLGAVQLYNQFNEDTGVAIAYTQQDIQRELLATSTPVPTTTATVAPASPTAAVVVAPIPTETATATATAPVSTISATAAASPTVATPEPSPTP